jgi:uncharacterized membrane protein YfcA
VNHVKTIKHIFCILAALAAIAVLVGSRLHGAVSHHQHVEILAILAAAAVAIVLVVLWHARPSRRTEQRQAPRTDYRY